LGAVFIRDREGVENDTEIDVSIIGGLETGFLARYFLRSEDVGKKPGFFDSTRVARNRVFARYFVRVL